MSNPTFAGPLAVFALLATFLATASAAAQAEENDAFLIGAPDCRVVNQNPHDNERITWSGACKDGFADGSGVLQWYRGDEKGASYEGEMRHGLPNGKGSAWYVSKSHYAGEFKDGYFEGKGILTSPDGTTLDATFVHGAASGYGEQTHTDGSWYRGEWKNGKYDGKGKRQYANGTLYEGDFKAGTPDGKGTFTYKDGVRYEGGVSNGSYNGEGSLRYATGLVYAGGWKMGKYEGKAKVTNPDGSTFEAEYRNGVRIDTSVAQSGARYAARVLRSADAIAEYAGPYDTAKGHKAFAQSPFGIWGSAVAKATEEEAKAAALEQCRKNMQDGEPPCVIADVDGSLSKTANAEQWRITREFARKYLDAMLASAEAPEGRDYEVAANRLRRLIRPTARVTRATGSDYEDGAKKVNAGDYEAAIAPLAKAAEAAPGVADIHYALAIAYLNTGHDEQAGAELTAVLLLRSSDVKAWRSEAKLFAKANDAKRAQQALLEGFEYSGDKNRTMDDYRSSADDETDAALRKVYQDVLPAVESRLDAWHAGRSGGANTPKPGDLRAQPWRSLNNTCGIPDYPLEARRRDVEGDVFVAYHIGEHGEVLDAVVIQSSGDWDLDDATLRGTRSCRAVSPPPQSEPDPWTTIGYQWRLEPSGKR